MFSSFNYLKRKTPEQGVNRKEFIEQLVEEYYSTTDVEAQQQVTANLANFAYDPLNWDYLKTAKVLKLFIELLEIPNESLQLHGLAGLCNLCLDPSAFNFIVKFQNIKIIKDLFIETNNLDAILNILTLFYQLLSQPKSEKTDILCPAVLKQISHHNSTNTNDKRILNLTSLLLGEFGKRYEFYEATNDSTDN